MRRGELHSGESRAKISASKAGKQFTEKHIEATRRALTGRPKSQSHKKAIAAGIRSARLAQQQVSITTLPTESINETSNRKRQARILRVHVHRIDKEVDPDDFIRAVDTYADWKIKAYLQKQKGNEAPQVSARNDLEEDW